MRQASPGRSESPDDAASCVSAVAVADGAPSSGFWSFFSAPAVCICTAIVKMEQP
jgi:hypothetical protein